MNVTYHGAFAAGDPPARNVYKNNAFDIIDEIANSVDAQILRCQRYNVTVTLYRIRDILIPLLRAELGVRYSTNYMYHVDDDVVLS